MKSRVFHRRRRRLFSSARRGGRPGSVRVYRRTPRLEPLEPRRMLTPVSGHIPDGTVWDLAGSPYDIVGDAYNSAGETLTIDPGVVVNTTNAAYDVTFSGNVSASGASFTGPTELYLYNGSSIDNCSFTSSDPIYTNDPSTVSDLTDILGPVAQTVRGAVKEDRTDTSADEGFDRRVGMLGGQAVMRPVANCGDAVVHLIQGPGQG